MKFSSKISRRAFTLIELLVVITIIAVLAGIALPVYQRFFVQAAQTKTLSNMRQMGGALLLYTGDNNNQLPGRVQNSPNVSDTPSKWPTLLKPYVQNILIYTSPIPDVGGKTYRVTDPNLYFNNTANYSSYIYNGFNDMGAFNDPSFVPYLNQIAQPVSTILLGTPLPQTNQFYMDFSEGGGNNNDVLNRTAFPTGSVYVFCDGSSRILKYDPTVDMKSQPAGSGVYSDWYWLMDKSKTDVIQPGH